MRDDAYDRFLVCLLVAAMGLLGWALAGYYEVPMWFGLAAGVGIGDGLLGIALLAVGLWQTLTCGRREG